MIDRLWKFSYILFAITVLWAIWIIGFVWQYYDSNISLEEGGILWILMFGTIAFAEIELNKINSPRSSTEQE